MVRVPRLLASLGLAASLFLGQWAGAGAEADWCASDPPVHLILPSGKPLEVNVWVAVPGDEQEALSAASISGQVSSVQGGVASVVAYVVVPRTGGGTFPVLATGQSHGPSNRSRTVEGSAGTTLVVPFTVTLPPGSDK